MSNKNKIHVIVNKHFEVEPFVAALMALNRENKLWLNEEKIYYFLCRRN